MSRYNKNIRKTGAHRTGKHRHCNFVGEDGFKCNHMFTTFDIRISKCPEHREEEKSSLTKGINRYNRVGNQKKMFEFVEWLMFQYEIDMEELDALSKWKKESDALGPIQTAGAATQGNENISPTALEETKSELADMVMPLIQEITNHAIVIAKLQKQLELANKRIKGNQRKCYNLKYQLQADIKREEE